MNHLKNPFFILFSASLLASFALSLSLGSQLYTYFDLSVKTQTRILSWEIRKKSANLYQVGAHYQYQTSKGVFENFFLFNTPFPNKQAALNRLTHLKSISYSSFYSSSYPEKSTLEHLFPYNTFFRWLLSVCLLIYFFSLFLNKTKKHVEN